MPVTKTPKRPREHGPVDSAGYPISREGLTNRILDAEQRVKRCRLTFEDEVLTDPAKTIDAEVKLERAYKKARRYTENLPPEDKNRFFANVERKIKGDIRTYVTISKL